MDRRPAARKRLPLVVNNNRIMTKRLNLFVLACTTAMTLHAQWTEKDSLKLQQILQQKGEIELNRKAVRDIDFGSYMGTPVEVDDEPGLRWDTTLPDVYDPKPRADMSLHPYNARTPFNYDPIRMKKFKVGPNTWKYGPYHEPDKQLSTNINWMQTIPTNWAKRMYDKQTRKTLEQIEAAGLRYRLGADRVNNMSVGAWQATPGSNNIGNSRFYTGPGVGLGIGGLDFNAISTREFWDKSIGRRRARTLEVLRQYGDSTTVNINTPLITK